MGTPGDQRRLQNVSDSKPSAHVAERRRNEAANTARQTPVALAEDTTTTPTMTVITRAPHFASFTNAHSNSTVSAVAVLLDNEIAIKTEPPEQIFDGLPSQADFGLDVAGPSGLQTPKQRSNSATANAPKKSKKTLKKQYVCSVCQKCFQNTSKLSKHQQIHGSGSPFKCEHCKKSFSSKFKLVRHVLIHSDRRPFSCTMCERTFHRKDHLKNHIKVHSPCKKIYECEKTSCKKEYTSLISYKKHLAFHAAEDGDLTCLICEKTFANKEEIMYHLKVHAGSRTVKNPEEKKYCCDHCQRKFFTRKDVRRHMVVHTGRRDFLCQFCPQRFGRKDHLVRHIKKSHSKTHDAASDAEVDRASIDDASVDATMIKSEVDEDESSLSHLSQPADLAAHLDLESLLPLNYLAPPGQTQGGELADLGCEVLDVIRVVGGDGVVASEEDLLRSIDDNFMHYLAADGDGMRETQPLPAFKEIFHQQPQQPPQPPSPRLY